MKRICRTCHQEFEGEEWMKQCYDCYKNFKGLKRIQLLGETGYFYKFVQEHSLC